MTEKSDTMVLLSPAPINELAKPELDDEGLKILLKLPAPINEIALATVLFTPATMAESSELYHGGDKPISLLAPPPINASSASQPSKDPAPMVEALELPSPPIKLPLPAAIPERTSHDSLFVPAKIPAAVPPG